MVHLEPLSDRTLEQAIVLANRVFPVQGNEPADLAFRISLDRQRYASQLEQMGTGDYKLGDLLQYWVAVEGDRVVGVTGIYTYRADEAEAVWVGWTCVDPDLRGQKIGRMLMDYVLEEGRKTGKPFFRLYTSTHPSEAVANLMYDQMGMVTIKRMPHPTVEGVELLFKELKLN